MKKLSKMYPNGSLSHNYIEFETWDELHTILGILYAFQASEYSVEREVGYIKVYYRGNGDQMLGCWIDEYKIEGDV